MSGAIYNVGIHLHAVNNISGVLATISKQFLGLHGSVHKLEKGISGLNSAIMGTLAIGAGVGLLKLGSTFEKAGEKLVHAETVLEMGLPKALRALDMNIARTAAYNEAGMNLNSTLAGNIEHMHDLYNVVQDMHQAADLLPVMNKLGNAFSMSKDTTANAHGQDSRQLASAARAFELTGRTDPAALDKIAQEYVRSVIGLRGRVDGNALLQAVQGAGAGRYGWTDDFISTTLPAMVNVMGGRTGSSLYHLDNNLRGGVASSWAQASMQEKWGLHKPEDEVRDPKTGKFQGFKVGSVWGADKMNNPLEWANAFREMLKNDKGVNIDDMGEMRNVVGEFARGNKLLQTAMDELLLPNTNKQMNKEVANIRGVASDAVEEGSDKDPKMWRKRLAAKWDDFEQAVGKGLVDPLIDNVLKPLTTALRDLSQASLKSPALISDIAFGLGALSAALITGGSVALMGALGPAGWLTGGIVLIVAAMKRFDPISFENFRKFFMDLPMLFDGSRWSALWERLKTETITGFTNMITGIGTSFTSGISAAKDMAVSAISSAFAAIGAALSAAIRGLGKAFGKAEGDDPSEAGKGSPFYRKQSFTPPPKAAAPVHLQAAWVVDGKVLAQAASTHMASLYEHPTSSHYHDGLRGFGSADSQYATG
ncbi:MAG: hypothetical protein JWM36_684 [Hyphomicrobiales bacterium]|nr:hypothetical protein [Hyphomicrobiales bacterium]